jgi:hypothetical protein
VLQLTAGTALSLLPTATFAVAASTARLGAAILKSSPHMWNGSRARKRELDVGERRERR